MKICNCFNVKNTHQSYITTSLVTLFCRHNKCQHFTWTLLAEYLLELSILSVLWLYRTLVPAAVNGMLALTLRRGLMHWRGGISKARRRRHCWRVVRRSPRLNYTWRRRPVVTVSAGFRRTLVLWVDRLYLGPLGSCHLLGRGRIHLVPNENPLPCSDPRDYLQVLGFGIIQILTVAMDTERRRRNGYRGSAWRELPLPLSGRKRGFGFVINRLQILSARFARNKVVYLFR